MPVAWKNQIDNKNIVHDPLLDGVGNGSVELESRLKPIFDPREPGKVIGKLLPAAARSWNAMARAAHKEGIVLLPTSAADTFRKLSIQQNIFTDRYRETNQGNGSRVCSGKRWYLRKGKATAACPGTSNHGRGRGVDFRRSADKRELRWMEIHAKDYGWQWELASEEWHVHYMLGDKVSQAVLDGEDDQQEDDMYETSDRLRDDNAAYATVNLILPAVGRIEQAIAEMRNKVPAGVSDADLAAIEKVVEGVNANISVDLVKRGVKEALSEGTGK